MKYLISGRNGFIGSAIAERLTTDGHLVQGIPRETLYDFMKLRWFVEGEKPNYIVHLAAYGNHYNQTDVTKIIEANINATIILLEASRDVPYKKFYNISSSSVTLPKQTFYSISKMATENIVNVFKEQYGKPIVNIRPYSVYGPGEAAHRFIPRVISCLHSGEEMTVDLGAVHDWIYIDCFIAALFSVETEIGTGESWSNGFVIECLEDISGKKLNFKTGKLRNYDNTNWVAKEGVPHISLYEGLKKTYEQITRKDN